MTVLVLIPLACFIAGLFAGVLAVIIALFWTDGGLK